MPQGLQLVLTPNSTAPETLNNIYREAFGQATEIYVATAYLTDWDKSQQLGAECKQLVFIAGTDFGLTRKQAMRDVLQWMPKRGACLFLAVPKLSDGGFHPKIAIWKSKAGKYYLIAGSSNLSRAAFGKNYEANIVSGITAQQYQEIVDWIEPLLEKSIPITADWIDNHYTEAKLRSKGGSGSSAQPVPIKLTMPQGVMCQRAALRHRKQQATFYQIKKKIITEAQRCASEQISNKEFWKRFWGIWANHESRFQGSGIQFTGKSANWRQACRALLNILDSTSKTSTLALDAVVSQEIDRLAAQQNPARGAWLSEMLCHYFPDLYPLQNNPVKKWLAWNKWRGRRGASQGQRYIELARQLRYAVASQPASAQNLAELDGAIWRWVKNRGL